MPPRRLRRARWASARPTAPDDLGVPRVIAEFAAGDCPEIDGPIARGELARLRSLAAARATRGQAILFASAIMVGGLVLPATMIAIVLLAQWFRLPPILMIGVLLPALAIGAFFMTRVLGAIGMRSLRRSIDLVCDALLRLGRCASCGYSLEHPAEDSGSVIRCAECGAGWSDRRVLDRRIPSAAAGRARLVRAALWASAGCRSRRRDDRGRLFAPFAPIYFERSAQKADAAERSLWPRQVAFVALVLAGSGATVGSLLLLRDAPIIALIATPAIGVATGLAAILQINGTRRALAHRRLRRRICLACGGRLSRDGDFLVCGACEGAWRRPVTSAGG